MPLLQNDCFDQIIRLAAIEHQVYFLFDFLSLTIPTSSSSHSGNWRIALLNHLPWWHIGAHDIFGLIVLVFVLFFSLPPHHPLKMDHRIYYQPGGAL